MGVNPVRYLVAPSLVAMLVMLPSLVVWADLVALAGAGLYATSELGMSFGAYADQVLKYLDVEDLVHGLSKSALFAALITAIAVVDGSQVRGGAEGVGRATTRSVVHAISAIVLTDMLFVYAATR
jgi:phospholipid/cholesterol/gamma-HCH transport system permease protein